MLKSSCRSVFYRRYVRQWGPRAAGGCGDKLLFHANSHSSHSDILESTDASIHAASLSASKAAKIPRKRVNTPQSTAASAASPSEAPFKKPAVTSGAILRLGTKGVRLIASKCTPAENFWLPCCDVTTEPGLLSGLASLARQSVVVALLTSPNDCLAIPNVLLASVRPVIVWVNCVLHCVTVLKLILCFTCVKCECIMQAPPLQLLEPVASLLAGAVAASGGHREQITEMGDVPVTPPVTTAQVAMSWSQLLARIICGASATLATHCMPRVRSIDFGMQSAMHSLMETAGLEHALASTVWVPASKVYFQVTTPAATFPPSASDDFICKLHNLPFSGTFTLSLPCVLKQVVKPSDPASLVGPRLLTTWDLLWTTLPNVGVLFPGCAHVCTSHPTKVHIHIPAMVAAETEPSPSNASVAGIPMLLVSLIQQLYAAMASVSRNISYLPLHVQCPSGMFVRA